MATWRGAGAVAATAVALLGVAAAGCGSSGGDAAEPALRASASLRAVAHPVTEQIEYALTITTAGSRERLRVGVDVNPSLESPRVTLDGPGELILPEPVIAEPVYGGCRSGRDDFLDQPVDVSVPANSTTTLRLSYGTWRAPPPGTDFRASFRVSGQDGRSRTVSTPAVASTGQTQVELSVRSAPELEEYDLTAGGIGNPHLPAVRVLRPGRAIVLSGRTSPAVAGHRLEIQAQRLRSSVHGGIVMGFEPLGPFAPVATVRADSAGRFRSPALRLRTRGFYMLRVLYPSQGPRHAEAVSCPLAFRIA